MLTAKVLAKLTDWTVAGAGPHSTVVTLPDTSWSVTLTAERVDSLASVFTRIDGVRELPLPEDSVAEEAHARKVAGRVCGLQESLALIEFDRVQHTALLRSAKPTVRGDLLFYYEVKLQGRNQVTVERLQANRTGPANRQAVPFALTHEVAAQFVNDLLAD
jgi:hypothetical protein